MKKLAIVGTADNAVDTPWDEMEVWVNAEPIVKGNKRIKRFDKAFEVHDFGVVEKLYGSLDEYAEQMNKAGKPVFMHEVQKDIPKSLKFPREEMQKYFGYEYYSCSIAWMLAYAIYTEQYSDIYLFGVEMAQDDEYANQRQSVEHWIGFARGKGIAVHVPPGTEIMTLADQYGYGNPSPELREAKDRIKTCDKGLAEAKAEQMRLSVQSAMITGQLQILEEVSQNATGKLKQEADEQIPKHKAELEKISDKIVEAVGIEQQLIGTKRAFTAMRNMLWRRGHH